MNATKDWYEHFYVESRTFHKQIQKLCSSEEEQSQIKNFVCKNRHTGDPIIGSSGIRKIRISLRGKGKRGGARIIYYFTDNNNAMVLFMMMYSKSDQENLTSDQEKLLLTLLERDLRQR